jgi:rubrerythrin
MNGVGKTPDNVKAAVEGEGHEFNVMYPEFIETAKKEGNQAALRSFQFAISVEKIHHDLYTKAAEALKSGNDMPATKIFVCPVCGNTVLDAAPDKCPICGVPGNKFSEIK